FVLLFLISGCAPVLSAKVMDQASINVPLGEMRAAPEAYRGQLFAFGGTIASVKQTVAGSLMELAYASVNSRGYLQNNLSGVRVLAFYPAEYGILDPVVFAKERKVTVAGTFDGLQEGKIEQMDYAFPFFQIREIYLWPLEPQRVYYYDPYWPGYPPFYFGVGVHRWR
ncbi:MAG TPA: Slp family lipoprotein, partial [Dissulfurispiraceae bacterium]|nr:Slp family lipoprotein [Dissulfurispiraceae bacterium]